MENAGQIPFNMTVKVGALSFCIDCMPEFQPNFAKCAGSGMIRSNKRPGQAFSMPGPGPPAYFDGKANPNLTKSG